MVEDGGLGAGARHAVDGAGRLVLPQGVAAGAVDGQHAAQSIAAHAGENDAHCVPGELVGGREHEDVDGRDMEVVAGGVRHLRHGSAGAAQDAELFSGAGDVDDAGISPVREPERVSSS
jgi:hypothetical protein